MAIRVYAQPNFSTFAFRFKSVQVLIFLIVDAEVPLKRSRHTVQEKRKLRNSRKRKKRHARTLQGTLKQELANEKAAHEATKESNALSKIMARSFWERWRYELDERKKVQKANQELIMSSKHSSIRLRSCDEVSVIPSIDRSLFSDPADFGDHPNDTDLFVGRGSFGVVKCQMYHGIYVAVKEFLPHTIKESVMKEACLLFDLCHPYLPLLFGVCISKLPYILVIQYYGIGIESVTFRRELREQKFVLVYPTWIILCAQVVEALRYLHTEVGLLHNDLKSDNVLITDCRHTSKKWTNNLSCKFQIVLVDFGKATKSADGKKYSLSFSAISLIP